MILDSLSGLDRVQLLEVYARSVMLPELGRCAEWVELFLPDARVSRAGRAEGGAEFRGREALLGLGRRMASGEFDVVTVTTLGGPNPRGGRPRGDMRTAFPRAPKTVGASRVGRSLRISEGLMLILTRWARGSLRNR